MRARARSCCEETNWGVGELEPGHGCGNDGVSSTYLGRSQPTLAAEGDLYFSTLTRMSLGGIRAISAVEVELPPSKTSLGWNLLPW